MANTGLTDPNWVISAGIGAGAAVSSNTGAYFADGPYSRFIGPSTQPALGGSSTYRTTFDVGSGLASISRVYWSDNELLSVKLNGSSVSIPLNGPGAFGGSGTAFSITSSFLGNVSNSLEFEVRNRGVGGGPALATPAAFRRRVQHPRAFDVRVGRLGPDPHRPGLLAEEFLSFMKID